MFNLATGKATMEKVFGDMSVEFPVIDLDLVGYKNRYTYVSEF